MGDSDAGKGDDNTRVTDWVGYRDNHDNINWSKGKMKIGIMMPMYNVEKWVRQAIESIRDQTFKDWHLVIVDDGSTDDSLKEAIDTIRSIANTSLVMINHIGCPGARNKAIDTLLGHEDITHIALMDADDICDPTRLEKCIKHLTDTDADIVKCHYDWINEAGEVTKLMKRPANATMIVKRKWFEKFRYPEHRWHGSDGALLDMMNAAGAKIVTLDECLYSQRRHPNQISLRKRNAGPDTTCNQNTGPRLGPEGR